MFQPLSANVKVIGIGGGGGNAVARMARNFIRGVDFVAINTDHQDLDHCDVKQKLYIGKNLTRGLGTGMNPDLGKQAAEENRSEIADIVKGADLVFLAAGFGGGTPFKIVANLPYAIATPWLDAVLGGPLPGRMVLMLQQEAANRYTARPGGKSFGAISVFLQAAYEVERGHKVAADCFYPRPDVESYLLNLARRPSPVAFPAGTKAAIRACFQQRRKQIGSLARDRLPGGGDAWMEHLRCAGLSPRTRPEAIPVALWMKLIPPVSAPACQTGPGALL